MKTYTVKITGTQVAGVVEGLALRSQWFTFEPLPDDEYEITVKAEAKRLLDGVVVSAKWLPRGRPSTEGFEHMLDPEPVTGPPAGLSTVGKAEVA